MLSLEDKGGRSDRNQPDQSLAAGKICIIYGFDVNSVHNYLNGLQCYLEEEIKRFGNIFYPVNERWFACSVYGQRFILNIREDHLTVVDDSDALVIEKLAIDR